MKRVASIVLSLFLIPINLVFSERTSAQITVEFQQGLKSGKVPSASTRTVLSPSTFKQCPNSCNSLGDVATALSNALRIAGYAQQAWYLVDSPDRNVPVTLVVTELENISSDGRPQKGQRWTTSYSPPNLESFQAFLTRLLRGAPSGRYRSFLFAFSSPERSIMQNVGPSWSALGAIADTIRRGNRVPVVSSLTSVKASRYQCYIFVYEYERSSANGSVRFIEESSLTAEQHLRGGGIWQALDIR